MARPTFHCVTINAVQGSVVCEGKGMLMISAERLPRQQHGMDVWKLTFVHEGKTLNTNEVKTRRGGDGVGEARAILSEASLYWRRRVAA
jgi:hypothetical protein